MVGGMGTCKRKLYELTTEHVEQNQVENSVQYALYCVTTCMNHMLNMHYAMLTSGE